MGFTIFSQRVKRPLEGKSTAFKIALQLAAAVLIVSVLLTGESFATVLFGETQLDVAVSEISPNPARPGEDLLIKINIENTGNEPARNVRVGIEDQHPFDFRYSTSKKFGSGTITEQFFQIEQISPRSKVELDFHFMVDSNASSGVYQLEFTILEAGGRSFSEKIPIRLEGIPDLVLTDTRIILAGQNENETAPSNDMVLGDVFYLRTTVQNVGNGDAKNVRVVLALNASSPIISLEDNVRFIEELEAGNTENLSFKLLLGSDAEVKPYKIPLHIQASNEAETFEINRMQEIGINVLHKADIDIASVKFEPVPHVEGTQVSMIVRLENVGEGEARSVKVMIEGLDARGTTQAFIGRLEKDDDAPAVFTFIPEKTGDQNFSLKVEYEDDFGKHNFSESIAFNVIHKTNILTFVFVGFAILVVAAFIFVIMKRKNLKLKEKTEREK